MDFQHLNVGARLLGNTVLISLHIPFLMVTSCELNILFCFTSQVPLYYNHLNVLNVSCGVGHFWILLLSFYWELGQRHGILRFAWIFFLFSSCVLFFITFFFLFCFVTTILLQLFCYWMFFHYLYMCFLGFCFLS